MNYLKDPANDSATTIKYIAALNTHKTFDEVKREQLGTGNEKRIYKLWREVGPEVTSPQSNPKDLEHHFLKIRVKPQSYLGKPAEAIFISDCTKKVRSTILQKQKQEQANIAQQTESFTSTVSHEMRTPLGSSVFFVKQIIALLSDLDVDPRVMKFLKLVMCQLTFMQSFVEDLLDLRQVKDGVFKLVSAAFDPNYVFQLIHSIFLPEAQAKGVHLSWSVETEAETNDPRSQLLDDSDLLDSKLPLLVGDERRFK